jgi:hypothetical protein
MPGGGLSTSFPAFDSRKMFCSANGMREHVCSSLCSLLLLLVASVGALEMDLRLFMVVSAGRQRSKLSKREKM